MLTRYHAHLFDLPKIFYGKANPEKSLLNKLLKGIDKQSNGIVEMLATKNSVGFDDEMDKLDKWAEDKRTGLKVDLKELDDELKELKKQIRQMGNLPEKLALQKKSLTLEQKRNESWKIYDDAVTNITQKKDQLIGSV